MGLSPVAMNGDTYNNVIHDVLDSSHCEQQEADPYCKEIAQAKRNVVVTSPDMCLKHDHFRQLLSSPKVAKKIGAFIMVPDF